MTVADIISQTQHKMGRTIETLREDFTKIRTGRASTGLLEHIMVDYYGLPDPAHAGRPARRRRRPYAHGPAVGEEHGRRR